MGSDFAGEGVRPSVIYKVGRWASKRAMNQYIRAGLALYSVVTAARTRARTAATATAATGTTDSCRSGNTKRHDREDGYEDAFLARR